MPIIEDVLGTGLEHRSVSQVTSFAQCAEAYRLSRVAQVPSKPAAWFSHGSAYHSAIEEYENSLRTLTLTDLEEHFKAYYRGEIADLKEKWPDEGDWLTGGRKKGFQDVEDREVIGLWQVADYVAFAEATKDIWRILPLGDGKVATEVKFNLTLGGVNVMGYIDQIRQYRNGALEVADLKTGTSTPMSMQLGVYAHVVEQNTGTWPQTGVFVKAGRPATARSPEKPTKDIPHSLDQWTEELLGSMFKDMDRSEKLGLFLPNAQDGCERTCTVSEHCRIKGYGPGKAEFATIRTRIRQTL